jgi:hypothetical protein
MVIFQLDVVHNSLNKLPQKSMDETRHPRKGVVIHRPQNGSGGIKWVKLTHGKSTTTLLTDCL